MKKLFSVFILLLTYVYGTSDDAPLSMNESLGRICGRYQQEIVDVTDVPMHPLYKTLLWLQGGAYVCSIFDSNFNKDEPVLPMSSPLWIKRVYPAQGEEGSPNYNAESTSYHLDSPTLIRHILHTGGIWGWDTSKTCNADEQKVAHLAALGDFLGDPSASIPAECPIATFLHGVKLESQKLPKEGKPAWMDTPNWGGELNKRTCYFSYVWFCDENGYNPVELRSALAWDKASNTESHNYSNRENLPEIFRMYEEILKEDPTHINWLKPMMLDRVRSSMYGWGAKRDYINWLMDKFPEQKAYLASLLIRSFSDHSKEETYVWIKDNYNPSAPYVALPGLTKHNDRICGINAPFSLWNDLTRWFDDRFKDDAAHKPWVLAFVNYQLRGGGAQGISDLVAWAKGVYPENKSQFVALLQERLTRTVRPEDKAKLEEVMSSLT